MDKHALVQKLKELAVSLGRTPTRDELRKEIKNGSNLITEFGGFSSLVQASGLEQFSKGSKKRVNEAYNSFISRKVEELETRVFEPRFPIFGPYPRIVAIGDIHAPWMCETTMMLIYQFIEMVKPEYIVVMGDFYDFFSQSKFPKQIMITPQDEVNTARSMLEKVFQSLKRVAPQAKIYNILGNHDLRPSKRLIESAPELIPFFDFDSFFKFPESELFKSARDPLVISGIAFHHGFMKQYSHMVKFGMPTVCGHTHNGGLHYEKVHGKWLWELNAGFVGDPSKPCFNYTAVKELNWTRGVGYISEWGPHFIPFE